MINIFNIININFLCAIFIYVFNVQHLNAADKDMFENERDIGTNKSLKREVCLTDDIEYGTASKKKKLNVQNSLVHLVDEEKDFINKALKYYHEREIKELDNLVNSSEDVYKKGIDLIFTGEDEELKEAIKCFEEIADPSKNPHAVYLLAFMYAIGTDKENSRKKNLEKSINYFTSLKENGCKEACYIIELFNQTPRQIEENLAEDEYQKWEQQFYKKINCPSSETAIFHAFGWGTARDIPRAINFLNSTACKIETITARFLYMWIYLFEKNTQFDRNILIDVFKLPNNIFESDINIKMISNFNRIEKIEFITNNYLFRKEGHNNSIIDDFLNLLHEKKMIKDEKIIRSIQDKFGSADNTGVENEITNMNNYEDDEHHHNNSQFKDPSGNPILQNHVTSVRSTGKKRPGRRETGNSGGSINNSSQYAASPFSDVDKENNLYEMMKEVSHQFLDIYKINFPDSIYNKTQNLIDIFEKKYNTMKPSSIDIYGLSCRARIYLLMKIMEIKREKLPREINDLLKSNKGRQSKEKFENLCGSDKETIFNAKYWQPKQEKHNNHPYWKVVDKLPTTFLFGDQLQWDLELNVTFDQPGNGIILNKEANHPCSHKGICTELDNLEISFQEAWASIKKQKVDGLPIQTGNKNTANLLNYYSFLLDFEVARRKVDGDNFQDLPLITCFPFLMDEQSPSSILNFSTLYTNIISRLFEGRNRGEYVREIIEEFKDSIPPTVKEIRRLLSNLHQIDEFSASLSSLESQQSQTQNIEDCYTNEEELTLLWHVSKGGNLFASVGNYRLVINKSKKGEKYGWIINENDKKISDHYFTYRTTDEAKIDVYKELKGVLWKNPQKCSF